MSEKKFNRPWVILAMEFAGATTMHGIRFLAEPTKFVTRRCVSRLHGNERHGNRTAFG